MIREKVLEILMENRPDIENIENAELVNDGLLDSFDIVTLVTDLDKAFEINIDGADITPENFNTVDSIVELVKKERSKINCILSLKIKKLLEY